MAEFHVAGRANDPELAEAEAIIEDLAMNLPDVTLVRHIKDPEQWASWSSELCQRMGFDENRYGAGPIVWSAGRIIGATQQLKEWAKRIYGRCVTKEYDELEVLSQENLRLCLAANKAQAERQTLSEELCAQITTLKEAKCAVGEQLNSAKKSVEEHSIMWNGATSAASKALCALKDSGELLKQAEAPSRQLSKLLTLVSRVVTPKAETPPPLSHFVQDSTSLDCLIGWLDCNFPSPMLKMGQEEVSRIKPLLNRAFENEGGADGTPEKALELWCHAVHKLSGCPSIAKLSAGLDTMNSTEKELEENHKKVAELQAQLSCILDEIADNSDPCDVQPAVTANLSIKQLNELSPKVLTAAIFGAIDERGAGYVSKSQVRSSNFSMKLLGVWEEGSQFDQLAEDGITFEGFLELTIEMTQRLGETECIKELASVVFDHHLLVNREA